MGSLQTMEVKYLSIYQLILIFCLKWMPFDKKEIHLILINYEMILYFHLNCLSNSDLNIFRYMIFLMLNICVFCIIPERIKVAIKTHKFFIIWSYLVFFFKNKLTLILINFSWCFEGQIHDNRGVSIYLSRCMGKSILVVARTEPWERIQVIISLK